MPRPPTTVTARGSPELVTCVSAASSPASSRSRPKSGARACRTLNALSAIVTSPLLPLRPDYGVWGEPWRSYERPRRFLPGPDEGGGLETQTRSCPQDVARVSSLLDSGAGRDRLRGQSHLRRRAHVQMGM